MHNKDESEKVEQHWNDQIEKEKKDAKDHHTTYHETSFLMLLSSLSMQAMIAMGKLENPITKQVEHNLEQARYLIDTLGILQEKTDGNRTEEEDHFLEEALFNLRSTYMGINK